MTTRKRRTHGARTVRQPAAKSAAKAIPELTLQDLAELTREFDDELIVDSFGEPTAPQRAQLQRAKRKRGRPQTGKGVKVISLSLERNLLAEADRLAKKLRVPRSQLISRGLRLLLETHNGPGGESHATWRAATVATLKSRGVERGHGEPRPLPH